MVRTADYKDTIVSLSSGLEKSAIAIIRISGTEAFDVAGRFLTPNEAFKEIKPETIYRLKAFDEHKNLLDNVLAIGYISPKSYTGENMLEIFCHGSSYIVRSILSEAIKNGARQAKAGEFTFRAFLNGKMDLAQAEAVKDLIEAETQKEHSAAMTQLKGDISKNIHSIKEAILNLLSQLEARIDDSYEEMPPFDKETFLNSLSEVSDKIKPVSSSFEKGKYLKRGLNVVIAGLPNCGKSSLLNAILGYSRAIVSAVSGTTRDTVEEMTEIGGYKFLFTDTAGINSGTQDEIEKEGISRSKDAVKKADLILFLKDSSNPATKDEETALETVKTKMNSFSKLILIAAKADLKTERSDLSSLLKISSITSLGMPELQNALINFAKDKTPQTKEIITSARHFEALNLALSFISEAQESVKTKSFESLETTAESLRSALNALGDIAGETSSDDVLQKVFSNFCVGK